MREREARTTMEGTEGRAGTQILRRKGTTRTKRWETTSGRGWEEGEGEGEVQGAEVARGMLYRVICVRVALCGCPFSCVRVLRPFSNPMSRVFTRLPPGSFLALMLSPSGHSTFFLRKRFSLPLNTTLLFSLGGYLCNKSLNFFFSLSGVAAGARSGAEASSWATSSPQSSRSRRSSHRCACACVCVCRLP